MFDEARDFYGAKTPEDARRLLVQAGRACVVRGSRGRLDYLVIDGQLQKRSLYYIFKDWAETLEGKWFLHKQDRESGFSCWCLDAQLLSGGPWTMPRESRAVFKNHAEHVQTWLDVLSQMGTHGFWNAF